jgi:hypothetical protein
LIALVAAAAAIESHANRVRWLRFGTSAAIEAFPFRPAQSR